MSYQISVNVVLSRAARALLREPDAAVVMDSLFSRYTSSPAPPAK